MSVSEPQILWLLASQYSEQLYLILEEDSAPFLVMLMPSCWIWIVLSRSAVFGPLSPWLVSSSILV